MLRINLADITNFDVNLSKIMAFHVSFRQNAAVQYNQGREDNMLCYIKSGVIDYQTAEKETFQAVPNDILFMPRGSRYQSVVPRDQGLNFIVIRFSLTDYDGLNIFVNGNAKKLFNDEKAVFLPLFSEICECFYASRGSLEIKKLCFQLISALLAEMETQHQNAEAWAMQGVMDYMRAHLSVTLSLEELASVARMSQRTFCRRFKEHTGLPPMQYHRTLRIQKAKLMLQNKLFSSEQIAAETGFTDAAHFYRCFEQIQGETVKEARKRMLISIHEP